MSSGASCLEYPNSGASTAIGFSGSEIMLFVVVSGSAFRHHAINCENAPEPDRLKVGSVENMLLLKP